MTYDPFLHCNFQWPLTTILRTPIQLLKRTVRNFILKRTQTVCIYFVNYIIRFHLWRRTMNCSHACDMNKKFFDNLSKHFILQPWLWHLTICTLFLSVTSGAKETLIKDKSGAMSCIILVLVFSVNKLIWIWRNRDCLLTDTCYHLCIMITLKRTMLFSLSCFSFHILHIQYRPINDA